MKKLLSIALIATAAAAVTAMDAAMLERLEKHYNSTKEGRSILHGRIERQIYLEDAGKMVDIYTDGYEHTNNATTRPVVSTPPTVTPGSTVQREKSEFQKRIDAISEARHAALTNITTVTEIITPNRKGTRTFSKLKLVLELQRLGKWDAAKAFIEQAGIWDLYNAAVNVKESDPYFKAGLEQVKKALNLTDADVELILSGCVAE